MKISHQLKTKKIFISVIASVLFAIVPVVLFSSTSFAGTWKQNSYVVECPDKSTTVTFETLTNAGDSTLITVKEGSAVTYHLVDTGLKSAHVASKLKSRGINKISYLIITHNHSDHIGGLVDFKNNGITVSSIIYNSIYSSSSISVGGSSTTASTIVKRAVSDKVITGYATQMLDDQHHCATGNNENMNASRGTSAAFSRVCRGRLYKLKNTASSNGFDLVLFPPMTDSTSGSDWSGGTGGNNKSMVVAFQTSKDRVILGGDLMAAGVKQLEDIDSATMIRHDDAAKNDAYAYYSGFCSYLSAATKGSRHTVYKVSHHGTGSNRVPGKANFGNELRDKISPDALVITGYNNGSGEAFTDIQYDYFENIFGTTPIRSSFSSSRWPY